MLAKEDDSDDEMYDQAATTPAQSAQLSQSQFPWYQNAYETVFDMNEGLLEHHQSNAQGYPTAAKTDRHTALRPK